MAKAQDPKKAKKDPLASIIQPGGMSTDTSLVTQPAGTTRMVLNGVNETNEGDMGFIAIEESNEVFYTFPAGFIPLGDVYIGNQESLIFLCQPGGDSIIGIGDRRGNFSIVIDDRNQNSKLGFRVTQQIEATYRLRRGCERTVYWIDPKPRMFILEKPEEFKDVDTGEWDFKKFNLFRNHNKIPNFLSIQVLNAGGLLLPGSYNFSVQYLDENLNPTEFVTSSAPVSIYVDDLETPYKDIEGSSALDTDYFTHIISSKSIRVVMDNLDTSFPFYRLAITEANGGTGNIVDTKVTEPIPINVTTFTYTGNNFSNSISQEEVQIFDLSVESAKSITQVENKLLLGDVAGSPINLCTLQKYASRIKADCVTKPIFLNQMQAANAKKPEAMFDGLGYMPGEIYSFGIVWVFADDTLSPAYHIPGKSTLVPNNVTFSLGPTFYPMGSDNASQDNVYTDNNTCDTGDYWGYDSEGVPLLNASVRHHRFPLRSEINKPLYTTTLLSTIDTELYAIRIKVNGPLEFPEPCIPIGDPGYDPFCRDLSEDNTSILVGVNFTLNGVVTDTDFAIGYETWDAAAVIGQEEYVGPFLDYSPILSSTSLVEIDKNGTRTVLTLVLSGGYWTATSPVTALVYTLQVEPWVDTQDNKLYFSEALGINFSNITKPSLDDTNGVEVIGYYIVRQDRTEEEKTILDSAVLTPTIQNKHFVSHGLLLPDLPTTTDPRLKRDFLAMINPEFKFNNKVYNNFSEVLIEGRFVQDRVEYSRSLIQNVMDGTSYNKDRHKKSERDSDGWSLHLRNRDSSLYLVPESGVLFTQEEIKDTFYLDALSNKTSEDSTGASKDIFNISCDNKIGILSLNQDYNRPAVNSMPYVLLKRTNANPYANFRNTAFYKESKDVNYFTGPTSTADTFNGDTYISSMKYISTVFYENRVRQRRTKDSVLSFILGGLLILAGTLLAVFTGGSSLLLVALGAGLVTGGGLLLASGIKQENWNKVYNDLYNKGLRETLDDDFLKAYYKNINPNDDEIRWFSDCLTNLWFESGVNMGLRQSANFGSVPSFIPAPAYVETGNNIDGPVKPSTVVDRHLLAKTTVLNPERSGGGREYIGIALPELYDINPDYYRRNKQKIFNHLGLEYDCCSDCYEKFPHRVMHSEQAFQEELTDNFRTFLPNNYIDIEGETGRVVDMFRIQSNLYIHTEEALWHLPQNFQERVTGDIISFIGTGEYFNIPPKKILDANDSSAGTSHKWGRTKTRHGVLFPSQREGKWYLFNGQELKAISDANMSSEFRKHMQFLVEDRYFNSTGELYQFSDNPVNKLGTGFVSTYDSKKERLIVTKKDIDISNLPPSNYRLCTNGDQSTVYFDFNNTVAEQEGLGYSYLGIENCQLKFGKEVLTEVVETRQQATQTLPTDVHVYMFTDTSGSFSSADKIDLQNAVTLWYQSVRPEDTGLTKLHFISDAIERYLYNLAFVVSSPANFLIHGGRVLYINFINEAGPSYHTNQDALYPVTGHPTTNYTNDYNLFMAKYPDYSFFKAVLYPITTSIGLADYYPLGRAYIQQVLLALKGIAYTSGEITAIPKNPAFDLYEPAWTNLQSSLADINPYAGLGLGLENYGFSAQVDRSDLGQLPSEPLISPAQFALDLNTLLAGGITPGDIVYEEIEVTTYVPVTEIKYVAGTPFTPVTVDNSVTLSYSLKTQQWVSWHSYLPHYYFYVQDKFFSWKNGLNSLYKHNKKGSYRTFYGVEYPFIIEVVDNPQVLASKITDGYLFQTEAKKWDATNEEFYDMELVTFNKVLAYNTRQISGWKNLVLKDTNAQYLLNQIKNSNADIFIDRNERDWTINELRDYSSNLNVPLFKKDLVSLQANYFIDKIVNPDAVNINKDWTQLESFRDKFLVVRLVFDTFTDINILMNFMSGDKKNSER